MDGSAARASGGHEQRTPRWIRLALGLALLVLCGFLLLGTKPWELPSGALFFDADRERPLRERIDAGLWWASLVNAFGCAALLATARWWARPLAGERASARGPAPSPPPRRRPSHAWLAVVLAAMVLALGLRLPLAQKSLWWDEGWTIRQVAVGWWEPSNGPFSELRFKEGGLSRALWYWEKPTNHVLYSVSAWTSLAGWRAVSGADPRAFDELAYRLPSLVASALSVGVIALLVRGFGLPGAALVAGLLLAIHPWHIRYGVDGRAYGLVILFTLAGALGLSRWLRSLAWRDLLLYAGSQWLLIWTYPFAAFVTLGYGIAALAALRLDPARAGLRWPLAARFAVVHVAVAMGLLQVLAPNLTQLPIWNYQGGIGPAVLRELWTGLTVGMIPTGDAASFAAGIPNVASLAEARPWLSPLLFGLFPLLLAFGFARACARGPGAAAPLAGLALAGATSLAATQALEQHFYARFASFLLPGVVVCLAVGVDGLLAPLARAGPRGRVAAAAGLAAALLAYQALVWPQTRLLLLHPYAPMRDVAERLAELAPDDAVLRVGVGLGGGMPRLYDPSIVYAEEATQLAELCEQAAERGRTLHAFYGYPVANSNRYSAVAVLEDPRWFEPVAQLWGIEPELSYRVFRLRGACPPG